MSSAHPQRTLVQIINTGLEKHGSYEDFMIELARQSRGRGIDLHFIFPAVGTPTVVKRIEQEGARVWVVPHPWSSRDGARRITRTLEQIRPQAADVHYNGAGAFLLVYLYCRTHGIRTSLHYHGEIRPVGTLHWRNRHVSSLRLLSWFADRYITVSQANARFLDALNVRRPADVIYNGVDVKRLSSQAVPKAATTTIRLVSIGSIIPRKRVDILIRAFALVRARTPDVHLTIIGGGSEQSACKALVEQLGLGDAVTLAGLLGAYPSDLLSAADVFVSASESESFGLMFAEAMCFRLPIVACAVGGIPEVVLNGKTGVLVRPNDAEAFAGALQQLIDDPALRARMGEEGFRHVSDSFDLATRTEELLELLSRDLEPRDRLA